jgi:hypothetical protein
MIDFNRKTLVSILPWAFIACFVLSALLAQLTSDIGPWNDRSPIESFTGGLLWMLSVLCLLNALSPPQGKRSLIFWLAGCVVLSILAIDEAMQGHEWVEKHWYINDDYPKIVLWILTLKVLYTIYGKASPYLMLKYIFIFGYIFHSFYILFEISDGEFYDVSEVLDQYQAKWGEELSELFFLSAYWLGFFLFYQNVRQPIAERGEAPTGSLEAQ